MIWFTTTDEEGNVVKVYVPREAIKQIFTGYEPGENDGFVSCLFMADGDTVMIYENQKEIEEAFREDDRKNTLYLMQ